MELVLGGWEDTLDLVMEALGEVSGRVLVGVLEEASEELGAQVEVWDDGGGSITSGTRLSSLIPLLLRQPLTSQLHRSGDGEALAGDLGVEDGAGGTGGMLTQA